MQSRAYAIWQDIIPKLPTQFWLLWWGNLINRTGDFVVPFLGYYLTSQLNWTPAQAAWVISAFGLGSFLAQFVSGFITDYLGRKFIMLLSFFSVAILLFAMVHVQNFALMWLMIVLLGLTGSMSRPGLTAAVADLVPMPNRTRAYAMQYWAINIGASVGPLLAGGLAIWGYQYLFYADAATSVLFGFIIAIFFRETLSRTESSNRFKMTLPQDRLLYGYLVVVFLFGVMMMQGFSVLGLAMQQVGYSAADFGRALSVNGLLIVILGLPAQMLLPKWPRSTVMALSGLIMGFGMSLHAYADTLPLVLYAVAIWSLGEMGMNTLSSSVIADLAPADQRGTYAGMLGATWGLALIVAPLWGGWLLASWGPVVLWNSCAVLGVLVAIGHMLLAKPIAQRTHPH